MKRLEYTVRFVTPAFLGNADQKGQWRTPPFKALLRQWWRVVHAASHGFDVDVEQMRRYEGLLFGNAWLSHPCQSMVRLRLSDWKAGNIDSWRGLEGDSIYHPEVQRTNYMVGPQAYLGYGPLDGRGGTQLTPKSKRGAIEPGEEDTLSLRVPGKHTEVLKNTLALMNFYGSVGGRCRNGWGAFTLTPAGEGTPQHPSDLTQFFRPWRKALELTWPHALGRGDDGRPLVWTTNPQRDWRAVMRDLALVRIGIRTQFMFELRKDNGDKEITNKHGERIKIIHGRPQDRHWLAYPVTNHDVSPWNRDTDGRLPNTLRFTVRPTADSRLEGVIFHVPCSPPKRFGPNQPTLIKVWETVHALLDELTHAPRKRRDDLRGQLDNITIKRSQGGCP